MSPSVIEEHIAKVRAQVEAACQRVGRQASEVKILAVSKTQPAEAIRLAATQAQQQAFGENYLQEALEKQALLTDLPLEWHFIGSIQSNKTRAVAEHFAWVHTLAREKIARRLSEQRPLDLPPLQVLLQVNISGEASKDGVAPQELKALAQQVAALPRLSLRGLMCIPEPTEDALAQRAAFAQLRKLLIELQHLDLGHPLDTLSIGMSADLEAAIAEGSTLVRIGTAIFGARQRGAVSSSHF
ncbi:YggS family pyridoxal phosphate-dependent enzyme [Marinospirillum sp. MEB164]|uniref:Pyridoxal phosphate homeostasis protein n=1 Tax=Marinospirillum alkalitolerans TaxID=3123374 RepID=A0ABW8PVR3_9GAMM